MLETKRKMSGPGIGIEPGTLGTLVLGNVQITELTQAFLSDKSHSYEKCSQTMQ